MGYDNNALEELTDLPWPHGPEDFEDLLTRIVTPPPRIPDDEENDRIIEEWRRQHPTEPPGPADDDLPPPRRDIYERGGPPDLFPYP
jgi:hypothetical protein